MRYRRVRFQGYFISFKVKFFDRIVDFSISRRNIPDLIFVGLSLDSHRNLFSDFPLIVVSISDHRLVVNLLSLISACITAKQQTSAKDCYRSSCTVKRCLTATSVIWSPRYYGHYFGSPAKRPYILCNKTLVNTITR